MSDLQGLQALLIRPKPILQVIGGGTGESLSEEVKEEGKGTDLFNRYLSDQGAAIYHCPVMVVSSLETPPNVDQIKAYILDFAHYDRAVFISRTAARLAMNWLEQYCVMVPEGLPMNMHYYAVGKSTANTLLDWGVKAELPEKAFSSEGLLKLPSLQDLSGEKIIIFCGEGGRSLLSEALTARGATVSRCELYQRQITREYAEQINSLLSANQLDLVIAHSGELLSHLLEVVDKQQQFALRMLPLLVPSERVEKFAKEVGFKEVVCAGSALPEDMVSALRGWYSSKKG